MFGERIQILLSTEQRRRLETEARRRRASVGSLIREAIDARFGGPSREERIRAFETLRRIKGGRFATPEELNRLVEEERDEVLRPLTRKRR